MDRIVANRNTLSDRFPVASFGIRAPRGRYYEVVCATDPALFHTDHRHRRDTSNFFTSRDLRLGRLLDDHGTFVLPPEQLRRFAGARRIYYAMGTYGDAQGRDPRFTIAPDALDQVPFVQLSADFTGRGLDRSRLGGVAMPAPAYGSPGASWGGDLALRAERERAAPPTERFAAAARYDDGYDPSFWEDAYRGPDTPRPLDDSNEYVTSDAGPTEPEPQALAEDEEEDEDQDDAYGAVARGGPRGEPPGLEHAANVAAYGRVASEPFGLEHPDRGAHAYGRVPAGAVGEPAGLEHPNRVIGGAGAEPPGGEHPARPTAFGAVAPEPPGDEHPGPRRSFGGAAPEPAGQEHPTREVRLGKVSPPQVGGDPVTTTAPAPARPAPDALPRQAAVRHPAWSGPVEEPALPAGGAEELPDVAPFDLPRRLALVEALSDVITDGRRYAATVDPADPGAGLQWGLLLFDQASGTLAEVLRAAMTREDASVPPEQRVSRALGFPDLAEASRLTDDDPCWRLVGRLADPATRLAPIDGQPLSSGPWPARFVAAAALPQVKAAQREIAVTRFVDAALPWAFELGLTSERALAFAVDRLAHMGPQAGRAWVIRHAGPIRTERERRAAERAVGASDAPWSADRHLELARALRQRPGTCPFPLPGVQTCIDRLVAAGRLDPAIAPRVDRLVASPLLHDHVLRPE